jgi:hypothetical protein
LPFHSISRKPPPKVGEEWSEPKAPQGEALMECPSKPVPEGTNP